MDDELVTPPKTSDWPPKQLDNMSIEALEHYSRQLEEELQRVRQTVEAKRGHRGAADALFRK